MKQKELFIIQIILMIKCCQKSLALRLYREILNRGTSVLSSGSNSKINLQHGVQTLLLVDDDFC